ncbi:MAG: hypothetical protein A3J54_03220 [Candidatus Ryanbacteria bacterium RIFCSPHIGHO2_02_FULL_45_13b]|uniref:PEGA domain-containing protein n=1 Tax=Candidatus Ryanbacteria bacterium RIFCSPHIGHO2_02_FULL_45_13b TaxID=1802117 RepID=A0A1G2G5B7_9BACT|nr:MAG: hypothetical protein A3J54_03220 [Candidatus Ryanbacteria bacterium RIFCSPHIGHO2_02_FULL_45_13b]
MTNRKRRILFLLSILAFLLLTGPVLLYTFGYRFSLSNFDIHKTGGIFIHTKPPGTNLIIGETERTTSYLTGNAFIQNLRPDSYTVRVSRKGYQAWEKIVDVKPQTVTELFPVLMPATQTITALKSASSTSLRAPERASLLILYHVKNTKHVYEFFDPNMQKTLPFADTISQTLMTLVPPDAIWNWNAAETSALVETSDNWIKLTRQNYDIRARSLYRQTPLATTINKKPRLMTQDPRDPDSYFLLNGTTFVRWNSKTRVSQELLESISGFFAGDTYLVLWDMQSNAPHITTLDATQPSPYATSSLPVITESRMEQIGDYLLVTDKDDTWLVSHKGKPTQLLTRASNLQHTLHTDAYILWWNDHEIFIRWILSEEQLPSFQKEHQERLYESRGTIIRNVAPYPEEHYLIIQEDNTIYTLELDGRGGTRNKHVLYTGNDPSFYVAYNKKILYVLDDRSLFAIELP